MEQLYIFWRNINNTTKDMTFVQKAIVAVTLTFIAAASATAIFLLIQSLYNQFFN